LLTPLQAAEEAKQLEDQLGGNGRCNRMFYFAIPPSVFAQAAATVRAGGFVSECVVL
jgi:glucose-6-phosphate 1-dehydrogenase